MKRLMLLAVLAILVTACATSPEVPVAENVNQEVASTPSASEISSEYDATPEEITYSPIEKPDDTIGLYQEKPAEPEQLPAYVEPPLLAHSLLKADRVVLDEKAIKTILSSRVVLPKQGHLGIIKFPGSEGAALEFYGYDYWRSENYIKTQQEYMETLSEKMQKSGRIAAVTLIPSLLAPRDATIPILREAAVRLQADLLLAYRITSDVYHQYKNSEVDEVKAFSTCEAVLLDIRTGLIPYTTLVTKESMQVRKHTDSNISETRSRAEKEAIKASLSVVANELTEFLKSVP